MWFHPVVVVRVINDTKNEIGKIVFSPNRKREREIGKKQFAFLILFAAAAAASVCFSSFYSIKFVTFSFNKIWFGWHYEIANNKNKRKNYIFFFFFWFIIVILILFYRHKAGHSTFHFQFHYNDLQTFIHFGIFLSPFFYVRWFICTVVRFIWFRFVSFRFSHSFSLRARERYQFTHKKFVFSFVAAVVFIVNSLKLISFSTFLSKEDNLFYCWIFDYKFSFWTLWNCCKLHENRICVFFTSSKLNLNFFSFVRSFVL